MHSSSGTMALHLLMGAGTVHDTRKREGRGEEGMGALKYLLAVDYNSYWSQIKEYCNRFRDNRAPLLHAYRVLQRRGEGRPSAPSCLSSFSSVLNFLLLCCTGLRSSHTMSWAGVSTM